MPSFEFHGDSLFYEEAGEGPPVVLLHGLLHRNWMQHQVAAHASERFRAISLEFSGHGRSSASSDASHYSMVRFADEVRALLDHLDIERAIVHGTSLGANVVVEGLPRYPERLAGAVVEMPVLARGAGVAMAIFRPLAALLDIAAPAVGLLHRALAPIPRADPNLAILLDLVPADARQAAAVLWGLIDTAEEPDLGRFRSIEVPTLVIGHAHDPLHSFSDAIDLVEALPNGELAEARSMLELRFSPDRLWPRIEKFYDDCAGGAVDTHLR